MEITEMDGKTTERYPAFDGLRGIAAFLILEYHFWWKYGYFMKGYLAVDFFFVLSGFLWMKSARSGRYSDTFGYALTQIKKYWPKTTVVLCLKFMLKDFVEIVKTGSIEIFFDKFIHLLYEIFYLHVVGIDSGEYLASYLWYIPVMIVILTLYTGIYNQDRKLLTFLFPIVIVCCYTKIFGTFGDLSDFRELGGVLIKGIERGLADIAVGAVTFEVKNKIFDEKPQEAHLSSLSRNGRIDELGVLKCVLELIIFIPTIWVVLCSEEGYHDFVVIFASVFAILLCSTESGLIHKIMNLRALRKYGELSLWFYLTQTFSIALVNMFVMNKVSTVTVDIVVLISCMLVALSIFIAFVFKSGFAVISKSLSRSA